MQIIKDTQDRLFAMELKNWSIGLATLWVIDRLLQSMVASCIEVKDAYVLVLSIGAAGGGAIAGRALHSLAKGKMNSVTNGNGSKPEGA